MLTEPSNAIRSAIALAGVLILAAVFLAGRSTTSGALATTGWPGPFRTVDGVTVGFHDTQAGADAAASHYLLEIERAMDSLSARRAASVADLVSTQSEAQAIMAHAGSVIALEQSHGAPLRRVAISTDPVMYSPTAARVTVLESWIYATGAQEALWAIERVSLVWQHGGWRVSAITGGAPSGNESLAELRSQLSFPGAGDASVR
ncbi:MAG: hypothetical protein ACR2ND_11805 [Solirubrobacteraceae bacterium]